MGPAMVTVSGMGSQGPALMANSPPKVMSMWVL